MAYLTLGQLLEATSEPIRSKIKALLDAYGDLMRKAAGSSHNHQAWEGGYLHHILETMNIAQWLHTSSPRPMPFSLSDVLVVMFLHDLEKPWKYAPSLTEKEKEPLFGKDISTKVGRRALRDHLIRLYEIELSEEQLNAIRYVEGVPDAEYTPGERTMGRLAAFCHCCDILSARLWFDRGAEGAW